MKVCYILYNTVFGHFCNDFIEISLFLFKRLCFHHKLDTLCVCDGNVDKTAISLSKPYKIVRKRY